MVTQSGFVGGWVLQLGRNFASPPAQVSLDSRVREGINQTLAEPSSLMYEEAQFQIYTLMHRDSFPRFLNSSLYRDLLANRRRACLDP